MSSWRICTCSKRLLTLAESLLLTTLTAGRRRRKTAAGAPGAATGARGRARRRAGGLTPRRPRARRLRSRGACRVGRRADLHLRVDEVGEARVALRARGEAARHAGAPRFARPRAMPSAPAASPRARPRARCREARGPQRRAAVLVAALEVEAVAARGQSTRKRTAASLPSAAAQCSEVHRVRVGAVERRAVRRASARARAPPSSALCAALVRPRTNAPHATRKSSSRMMSARARVRARGARGRRAARGGGAEPRPPSAAPYAGREVYSSRSASSAADAAAADPAREARGSSSHPCRRSSSLIFGIVVRPRPKWSGMAAFLRRRRPLAAPAPRRRAPCVAGFAALACVAALRAAAGSGGAARGGSRSHGSASRRARERALVPRERQRARVQVHDHVVEGAGRRRVGRRPLRLLVRT